MFRKITESNSLLLPLIFFLPLRVSTRTRACTCAQRHAEARKEDKGNIMLIIFFVLLSKREMHPHNVHLPLPQMQDALI
jgi:hypothetical protein